MKNIIRIEEFGMFLLSVFLFWDTGFAWWWFPVLLLTPDISMIGYAINNTAGAFLYNLFHHKAFAIALYFAGFFAGTSLLELAGIILFGHSSMDRMFGYGLKFKDSFKHTHLGWIGET
jgi:hypothetical protein